MQTKQINPIQPVDFDSKVDQCAAESADGDFDRKSDNVNNELIMCFQLIFYMAVF